MVWTTASDASPSVGGLKDHVQHLEGCFEMTLEFLLPHVDAILSELERRLPPEATTSPIPTEVIYPSQQSTHLHAFPPEGERSRRSRSSNSARNSRSKSHSRRRADLSPISVPLHRRNCTSSASPCDAPTVSPTTLHSSKHSPPCSTSSVNPPVVISSGNEFHAYSQRSAVSRSVPESSLSTRRSVDQASAHSSVSFRVSTRTSEAVAATRSNASEKSSASSATSLGCTPTPRPRVTAPPSAGACAEDDLLGAARDGRVEAVLAALEAGTDVNSRDASGKTALHLAAWKGHADVVALLLTNGADPCDTANAGAYTPLHVASFAGHAQCVAFLLDAGVAVDRRSKKGSTALHMAALNGYETVVQLLVAAGACRQIADESGRTAYDLSETVGIRELLLL